MRKSGLLMAAMVAIGSNAVAQQRGAVELGGFVHAAYFDKSLNLDQGPVGYGGLIGFFPFTNLALEGEVSHVKVDGPLGTDWTSTPLRARLVYNMPIGSNVGFLLGGGYVHSIFGKDVDFEDKGATGHVGFRLAKKELLQLRIGGNVDYIPSPENGEDHNLNWNVSAGVSLLMGNKRAPADTDKDGVPDTEDQCPNTLPNRTIDTNGCSADQRDTDRDGVNDELDRCPRTPAGDQVDASGCSLPKDADKDGVTDDKDACPNTPSGEAADARGCSPSQRDSDNDGVKDNADRCANTPAGTKVDATGCPVPQDGDGDGVPDDRDSCPNTPRGVKVDTKGCHELPKDKEPVTLHGVTFEFNKSTLTTEAQAILKDVAQSLQANPEVRIEVQGHTDNIGTRAVNQRLSNARANAVKQFLTENGVAADRLTSKGYGYEQPVASNDTDEGRAQNRRVVMIRMQ